MTYTVYILFSARHQKIYIGYTSNLITRIRSHNTFGKDWTKNWRPWIVVYCEYFRDKGTAMQRERQLKSAKAREVIWQKIADNFFNHGYIEM